MARRSPRVLGGVGAPAAGRAVTGPPTPAPAVPIDSIQEVSEGRQSEVFQRYPDSNFDPNCCFSIYHGSHRQSLGLVSPSGDEARTWVTGLRYLMAGISDEDSLARRQRTRDQYPWARGRTPGTHLPTSGGASAPGGPHVWGRQDGRGTWAAGGCGLALSDLWWPLTQPQSG